MTGHDEYLQLEDVIALASLLLGDPPPIRDLGLLNSAVARPETTVFGQDAYPDVITKAAALLQSIVNNRALIDGNKRLGWLSTAVFLQMNGVNALRMDNDAVYDFVIWVASTNPDIDLIANGLRELLK
jgi:death-on-curing protein